MPTTLPHLASSHHHHLKHTHTTLLFGESQTKAIDFPHSVAQGQNPQHCLSPSGTISPTLSSPLVSVPIPPGQFVQPDSHPQHWAAGGSLAWPLASQFLWLTWARRAQTPGSAAWCASLSQRTGLISLGPAETQPSL